MRYPISIQTFETIINGNYVYVDKTDLVYRLAQEHVCFLSRPRRFGKSLLISTLDAYFSGRKELFQGLKMAALEHEWDVYPIFRIDFANGNFSNPDELTLMLEGRVSDWERIYGKDDVYKTLGDRFKYVLEQAAAKTGKKVVVLIDECDRPLLDVLGEAQEDKNRNILKNFYATFKAADASLRFVLLTGVTKFSLITVFSGFNQPNDISMDSRYDAICGITEAELHNTFFEAIVVMAKKLGYTVEEMKAELKRQYDGYHFSNALVDVYNPFSIINAFNKLDIDNYWYKSGTPTYLVKLIEGNNINMQKLTSRGYESQYFVDYRADAEEPLAMLYQSGYLTIKSYDKRYREYTLDYPNVEVSKGFVTLMANSYLKKDESEAAYWIVNLDRMLRRGDLNEVRDAFTAFLASIPYEANKDERAKDFETHFQYTFYIIFRLLSCYTTLLEKQNSKGRADIIIESDNDIYIFEFKLDGSAEEALQQIEDKQYALPYLQDKRKLHKIGVNISSSTRTVDGWLEA
ncbi:ATP-binding protein [uncultured Phascolarctobacterium sp.]|uniref:ATP-binding protein n=1 Tax=uncultured Phascolarctobacterium sp. TaxID=512296 RepID=UPI00263A206E|nr:ATP-binding protein [uncultured Phascolarctobacterium sp.]